MEKYLRTFAGFMKYLNDTSLTNLREEEKAHYEYWESIAKYFQTQQSFDKYHRSKKFNLKLINDSFQETVLFITRTIYKHDCGFCGLSWATSSIIDTFYEFRKEAGCEVSPVNFKNLPPTPSLFTGWVCPMGNFYPCSFTGHKSLAENIMNDLFSVSPKERVNHERLLEEKGYVKFAYDVHKEEYNIYSGIGKELTSGQYRVLLDMIAHLDINLSLKSGKRLKQYIVANYD